MSFFHVLTPTFTAGSAVTANSEASAAVGAANLIRIQQDWFWRSAGLSNVRITIDATETRPWDTVALAYHNITSSGTVRVTSNASTGSLFTSPSYDSGALSPVFGGDLTSFTYNHFWFASGAIKNFRYIGLEINDATNTDGYVRAGVVMAGEIFTPTIGADLGSSEGPEDPSEEIRMVSGSHIVRPKRQRDGGSWAFPKQNKDDRDEWKRMTRVFGRHTPVIFKWDPPDNTGDQETFYYGYLRWQPGRLVTFANGQGLYDVEMGIAEV